MKIQIKILNKDFYAWDSGKVDDSNVGSDLPSYATLGSAAIDLICTEDIVVYPGETKAIHTGLAIWLGSHNDKALRSYRQHWDYAGLIVPRSGLGTRGLVLANTVGLIDSDYQGELIIQAWNRTGLGRQRDPGYEDREYYCGEAVHLDAGQRIAQLMIVPVAKAQWEVVEDFSNKTERGLGGFGSTDEAN